MNQLRNVYPETPQVLLDTGNFSDNPTPTGDVKTHALLEAMGRLGYQAANVGERDLLMGYQEFVRKTEGTTFPFVSTNFVRQDTKEPVFKPYVVVEAKRAGDLPPLRIAVLGVVRFNPLFLKSGPDKSNLVIASPRDMVRRYLPEARKKSDLVVVLAAIHQDDARLLAKDVIGIDFILGAYGDFASTAETFEGKTRILYSGNQGKQLGETRLFFEGRELRHAVSYVHTLNARYPDDPKMLLFMNEVAQKLNEQKSSERKRTDDIRAASARRPFAGASACQACHAPEHVQWSATVHAHAYETLVQKKKEEDLSCLTCHVTGAGQEGGYRDPESTPELLGVSCESCHGPGAAHAAQPKPGYGKTEIASCIGCHNRANSPKFDYYTYLQKVVHGTGTAR